VSLWLIIAVVSSLVIAGFGLHRLADGLRAFPTDTTPTGPVIQRPPPDRDVPPPPSLAMTEQLIADAAMSRNLTTHRLWPLIAQLARAQRVQDHRIRPPDTDTLAWLRDALDALEGRAPSAPSRRSTRGRRP